MPLKHFFILAALFFSAADSLYAGQQQTSFIQNHGQIRDVNGNARPDVLFMSESNGMKMYFLRDRISYVFSRPSAIHEDDLELYRMDMVFHSEATSVVGENAGKDIVNFYSGEVEAIGIPVFQKIRYRNVLGAGSDLVFYSVNGSVKYEYELQNPAQVSRIQFHYEGATRAAIETGSGILVECPGGSIHDDAPVSFQNGIEIPTQFRIAFHAEGKPYFGYTFSGAVSASPIVIDPTLSWATYYGGTNIENQRLYSDIACDSQQNVIYVGHCQGTDFPVSIGAWQGVSGAGGNDAVIVKFDSAGNRIWATYFGGTAWEVGNGIAFDGADNFYFTGSTSSSNFPVTPNSNQPSLGGGQDVFLVKFSSAGTRIWGTFLGGSGVDEGIRVAFTPTGKVLVSGNTQSLNFPVTPGAYQSVNNGVQDAFLASYDTMGNKLWATLVGGNNLDNISAIGGDSAGAVLFGGNSNSNNLATTVGAFQTAHGGLNDGIVGKFDALGNLAWLTFIGGAAGEDFLCGTVDVHGNIYLGGRSNGSGFPTTTGAIQPNYLATVNTGVIAKFDNDGNLVWGSFFGGGTEDRVLDMNIAANNLIMFTGETRGGSQFPVTAGAMYPTLQGGLYDVFVAKVFPNGILNYASFYGATGNEYARALGVAPNGDYFLLGATDSSTTLDFGNAFQSNYGGGSYDAFVSYIRDCGMQNPGLNTGDTAYFCQGNNFTITATNSYPSYSWTTGSSSNSITVNTPGWYGVTVTAASGCKGWDSVYLVQRPMPTASITPSTPQTTCDNTPVNLSCSGADMYQWYRNGGAISGATAQTYGAMVAGTYTVKATNFGGCSDSTTVGVTVTTIPAPTVNLGPDRSKCPGDTVMLDAGTGFTAYNWCSGQTAQVITVSTGGNYCVTVTSANGCMDSDSVLVTLLAPVAGFTFTHGGNPAFISITNTSVNAVSYQWDFGDGTTSTNESPTHTFPKIDTFYYVCLTVTDTNGCTDEFCDSVGLGIFAGLSESVIEDWKVFPNPGNGILNFSGNLNGANFSCFDLNGKLILAGECQKDSPVVLPNTATGLLLLTIQKGNQRQVFRIVVIPDRQ